MFKSIHSIEIFFHYSHPYRIIKSDMSMRIYFYSESGKRESTKYCFDNLRKILSIAKNMQRYEDNPCAYHFLFKDQRFLRRTRKQSSLILPSRIPLYEPFCFTISARCSSFFSYLNKNLLNRTAITIPKPRFFALNTLDKKSEQEHHI